MWKAWPYGSRILNIVFGSFHYDLLGTYNLQLRFVLLFKEIEVHSHLQTVGFFFFYMHHWQRFAFAIFFICFMHWQQLPKGKMCVVTVKGTPIHALNNYHQGAFEQHTHRFGAALWPADKLTWRPTKSPQQVLHSWWRLLGLYAACEDDTTLDSELSVIYR